MKIKRLKIALLCTFPLISFILIKQEWIARLIAITGVFGILNLLIFLYGLNPKSNFIYHRSKLAKSSEKTRRNAQWVFRFIIIGFGLFIGCFMTAPNFKDCLGAISQGQSYLVVVDGKVRSNDLIFGTFFLIQPLNIEKNNEVGEDSYTAIFFPKIARVGNTYRFLVAPKSKAVLEWTTIGNK